MRHALLFGMVSATLVALPATAVAATPWSGLQAVTTSAPSFGRTPTPAQPPTPVVAVNGSGQAVAVWWSSDGGISASRRAPAGDWTPPQTVSPTGKGGGLARGLDVAIDAAGDATVAWAAETDGSGEVLSATSLAGGTFGTAVSVKVGAKPSTVDVAMNASGETALVFDGVYASTPVYATPPRRPAAPGRPRW